MTDSADEERTTLRRSSPPFALSPEEYVLVASLTETMVPAGTDPKLEPGAKEVGAKNYFDSAVYGLPPPIQAAVKNILLAVQEESKKLFDGRRFQDLTPEEKAKLIEHLQSSHEFREPVFIIRAIVLEGFYSDYHDPGYRGRTAWDVTEFSGKRISGIKKDWSFLRIYQVSGADV